MLITPVEAPADLQLDRLVGGPRAVSGDYRGMLMRGNVTWDAAVGRVLLEGEGFPGAGFWAEPPLAVQWPIDQVRTVDAN